MCKYISSVASVLNFIRLNFWIILRKQVMERSITKCFICKHVQRKTLLDPKTRSLPAFCIKLNHSFKFVRVKYGRSIHFETNKNTRKCYIL